MTEEQNQDAPQTAESAVLPPEPETPAAPEPAPAEEKQERLVESSLEASHSEALPLSPIDASSDEPVPAENGAEKKQGRRGLRRGNAGRGRRDGKNAAQSVGIVENPGEVKETLSGKFVDGYEKDKEFRRARERREKTANVAATEGEPNAQGWCLKDAPEGARRRHPQSNTNSNRAKLIIEPAPIPEQEKDPSFWQKFKAKILSIFGLDKKKKKHDKKRRGGKYRNKHGKKFRGGKNDRNGGNRDFRGGNRRGRHHRGPRPGNSGARPQNGGNGNTPAA